ncbi:MULTISPECIES: hypothetical protein [Bordetella]|uniref:Uncharacterized protein n=1 Tax=Bordetella genomosp. 6 TaxID=463024 RepID=A0ABX4FHS1_9BORD|nr:MULTISPECIES: hypothetical protein [Bordetella]SHT15052.1 Uncharacterised protein [Mycobacteroides abscessus subsp. abscessus]AOB26576.1 hypothetical protein BBB44_10205 [Bordetella bronchiseptica]ARP76257.1 hypothetical protein CAL11_08925 [Bordetella genomosp. 6]AZW43884.1 hypothetical protein CWR61_10300 [Bordetella bronchiseptica]MBN3269312.1 hypothetical protein [Bordetella bronchiseptica]
MVQKVLNGFAVVAFATQPEHGMPPRAFIQTAPVDDAGQAEPQVFEIFLARRFRSAVEAMSAARNALDRVVSVDQDGVPAPLPD